MPKQRVETKKSVESQRSRQAVGRMLWLVVIVWLLLFSLIRLAFRWSGNALLNFALLLFLFFVALFIVRYSLFRVQYWWRGIRPFLVRALSRFFR